MFAPETVSLSRPTTRLCSGVLMRNTDLLWIASDQGLQVLKIIFFWIGFFYIITSITDQNHINVICVSIDIH